MNSVGSVAFFPSEKTSNSIFYQGWRGKKRRKEELPHRANKIKVRTTTQAALSYRIRSVFPVCEINSESGKEKVHPHSKSVEGLCKSSKIHIYIDSSID